MWFCLQSSTLSRRWLISELKMKFLNGMLMEFRECFSRKAAFQWFVVIVVGLMVRTDHVGVTSIIRGLLLAPNYISLIRYMRTYRNAIVSEATVADFLRKNFFCLLLTFDRI